MTDETGDDGVDRRTDRRTFMKTVGVAGGAAILSQSAAAGDLDRVVGDGLSPASGRRQEAVIVFADGAAVDRLEDLDLARGYHAFETLPMAYAELDGDQIREVAGWASVMRVVDNREAEFDNHDSKEDTRAREVWENPDLGYTGENVHVAIIDSGLDGAHPGHVESVESNYQYVGNPESGDLVWQDVSPGNNDDLGHGTHVAGSITGGGDASLDEADYAGMAPDATLTAYSAPMLGLTRATRVAAYDHIIAGKRAGDHDIRLVSNSWTWGNEYDPWNPVPRAVWEATKEGILTLFSAGNDGPEPETLGETKDPFVLSVGATDAEMAIAGFSSRGVPGGSHDREETLRNITTLYEEELEPEAVEGPIELERPGVAAKGDTVMSTQSADSAYYSLGALDTPISVPPDPADPPVDERGASEPLYGSLSGTSMSCPTTAGVVALFLDAYYDAHGEFPSPIDTINTMEATAREAAHESYLRTNVGAGYVDAVAAVEAALDADGLPAGVDDGELPPGLSDGDLPPGLARLDGGLPGFEDVTLADPHPDADRDADGGPPREPTDDDPQETVDRTTVSGELLVGAGSPAGADGDSETYTTDFAATDREWRLIDARIEVDGPPGFEWTDLRIDHQRDGEWVAIGARRFEAASGELRIVGGWLEENPGAEDVAVVADDETYRVAVSAATELDAAVTYEVDVEFVAFDLES